MRNRIKETVRTPTPAARMFERADRLFDSGRFEEALSQYEVLSASLQEVEDRVTVLLREVGCLVKLARTREARSWLRKADELLPADNKNYPHLRFAEAGILHAEGNRKKALRLLGRLVKNKEALLKAANGLQLYQEIQLRRVYLLVELQRDREARPLLEEVLTFGIKDVSVPYYAGYCYLRLHDFALAQKYFEEALEMGLTGAWEYQARTELGHIYNRFGALAKAKLEFERAARLAPRVEAPREHCRRVYGWLAYLCRELGQEEEAVRYEKILRGLPPTS